MYHIDEIIEFNRIKEELAAYTHTEAARQSALKLEPFLSEMELEVALRETSEAREVLDLWGAPPFTGTDHMEQWMEIAVKGGCLTPEQLESVGTTLGTIRRIRQYLEAPMNYGYGIGFYREQLDALEDLIHEIHQMIRFGKVDDRATPLLQDLRTKIDRETNRMRERGESILRSNKNYLSDSFSTIRNGRICLPVKKEYRQKISGSVIDKSATGSTLFIEPEQLARMYSQIENLKIDEENEVNRILYTLTGLFADQERKVASNTKVMERLDFLFAKGKLSQFYEGVRPDFTRERKIVIVKGRHPFLERSQCVPLNFQIGNGINGILITGPNTGGKTVAIKTVALNSVMAQSGLHVPCESAIFTMQNLVLCDIGDGQNIAENLSTFSSHITNLLSILEQVTDQSLVILDELGSGTDPAEGMGIAIAVIDELRKRGALFLVTTHYPEVKQYANGLQDVSNARMTFDKESLRPLYQLEIGEAGESCALYIAARLGMPLHLLEYASMASYGKPLPEEIRIISQAHEKSFQKMSNKIRRKKDWHGSGDIQNHYQRGDSVMLCPDNKIGIVCETADLRGNLVVQLPGEKISVNHKRLKLLVPASELYPEDYDFSTIFDTVEFRKKKKQLSRKYQPDITLIHEENKGKK